MKKFIITLATLILVLVIGYGAGIGYYADKFQANSHFGSIDVSNRTLNQAKQEIEKEVKNRQVQIDENGKKIGTIKLGDLDPSFDLDQALKTAYDSQNPNTWLLHYFSTSPFPDNATKDIQVDQVKLDQALTDLGLDNEGRTPTKDAAIEYNESDGYHITQAEVGNQVDLKRLDDMLLDGIQTGKESVDLKEAYVQPEIKADDQKLTDTMKKIDQASQTQVTLTIAGEEEKISKEDILKWIGFDSNNEIDYDQEAIAEYVNQLNEKYATFNKPRTFNSTLRGEVEVQAGTLGWSIDTETEAAQIAEDLKTGKDVKREPAIIGTGYGQADDNIGNSYVEIDMENQTMFVYKDGNLVVETPIVTGKIGTDTVPGAYAVWDKEENAVLKGYNPHTQRDYQQPVSYWMPFDDTGQGIHDANWQSNFGGTTYQNAGSLGCINTPPNIMPEVFANVDLGTPVMIF